MKKELVLAIISTVLAGILITSCATAPPVRYYVCTDGRQVLDANQCALPPPKQEEPTPLPIFNESEPEPVKVILSDTVKPLFDKAAKVSSLQFYYVQSPNTIPDNHYFLSRSKMKIELKTKARFDPNTVYDTIYLDFNDKTAFAYCESSEIGVCIDRNRIFTLNYNDYIIITPFDWLSRITWADTTGRSKMLDTRNAIEISFKIKDNPGTMFVDSFFGIPMVVTYNGNTFQYLSLAENLVNESLLVHQLLP